MPVPPPLITTALHTMLSALADTLIAAFIAASVVVCWQTHFGSFILPKTSPPPTAASARDAVLAAVYFKPRGQCGGGTSDVARQTRVVTIAEAIRRQLGEIVNKPGLKAIEAVLLMIEGHSLKEAIKDAGSSNPSVRKYRPLVDQVIGTCALGATLAAAAVLAGPTAAGVAAGSLAIAVLPPRSLPNVISLRLHHEYVSDGHVYRIWNATLRCIDGATRECQTEPVLHEPVPPGEEPSSCRRREDRENKRLVTALRALDPAVLAAGRLKDRDRKRAKAVLRASQLPALPIADDDPVWLLPPAEQPHFIGEHVWYFRTVSDVFEQPQLATIQQLFRDGSAELTTTDGVTIRSSNDDRLSRVGLPVPSYVGQRVELVSPMVNPLNQRKLRKATGERQLATVKAVNADGTIDVQLVDASLGDFTEVRSCIHVKGVSTNRYTHAPATAILRDVAMMLADVALVKAGHPTLDELANKYVEGGADQEMFRRNGWALAGIRWLCPDGIVRQECESVVDSDEDDTDADADSDDQNGAEEMNASTTAGVPFRGPGCTAGCRYPCRTPRLADRLGPQLTRGLPGMPICRRSGCAALCDFLDPSHFRACDHPPDMEGPHAYILVNEAEAAGADMTAARELLGVLESSPLLLWPNDEGDDVPGGTRGYRPLPSSTEEWKAFVYAATHWVEPDDLLSNDASAFLAAAENADIVTRKQQQREPPSEPQACVPPQSERERQPRFLRVAKRMRQWRERQEGDAQSVIDWCAMRAHSRRDTVKLAPWLS
jgi:hypothetical protein